MFRGGGCFGGNNIIWIILIILVFAMLFDDQSCVS